MTFTHLKFPIHFKYEINGIIIQPLYKSVTDLGFILCPTLSPNLHIEHVCCKSLKILGFIKRIAAEFKLASPLKALYCSLVRPILEYGSVIWDPSTAIYAMMLERVQNKFLKYASHVLNIKCPPHNFLPVREHLKLDSLADRRRASNLAFLSKLLNGQIVSPHLLSLIPFNVPPRFTRQHTSFNLPISTTNYGLNDPIRRCMSIANSDPSFSITQN